MTGVLPGTGQERLISSRCECLEDGSMARWDGEDSGGGGVEAQAAVIGEPVAFGIAQDGTQEGDGFGDGAGTVPGGEAVEYSVAEGVEPGFHAGGQGSGAGDQFNGVDHEAGLLEEAGVGGGRRVEGVCGSLCVDMVAGKRGLECDADGGDVAVAAHLCDEPA